MNRYLPPAANLLEALGTTLERLNGPGRTVVDTRTLRNLIEIAASTLPFNETAYRHNCPDLDQAVLAGQILDLRKHYIHHGYLEGRIAIDTDFAEEWYLSRYPDVQDAVDSGSVDTAYAHYDAFGRHEGRFPSAEYESSHSSWLAKD